MIPCASRCSQVHLEGLHAVRVHPFLDQILERRIALGAFDRFAYRAGHDEHLRREHETLPSFVGTRRWATIPCRVSAMRSRISFGSPVESDSMRLTVR